MIDSEVIPAAIINETRINAPASMVWNALTYPELMKQWMMEEKDEIQILTDWKPGSPVIMRGDFHGIAFENRGLVLIVEQNNVLCFSHLSSLSNLPDSPESYSVLRFELIPEENQTLLRLTIEHFPTFEIYKHLAFYWSVTLGLLKAFIEKQDWHDF